MPALVRATRRVDYRIIECEVVTTKDGSTIEASRRSTRRPPVAVPASVPESTSSNGQTDVRAAHEKAGGLTI